MRRMKFGNVSIEMLVSYIEGSADNSIRLTIEEWLTANPENRIFFDRLSEAWKNPQDLKALGKENIENDWKVIFDQLTDKGSERKTRTVL